jgi:hypothetical protein
MNYKDFYYWLDGFMTNRSWTIIQQIDIETIQEKLKEVKGDSDVNVDKIMGMKNPLSIPINIDMPNPFKEQLND